MGHQRWAWAGAMAVAAVIGAGALDRPPEHRLSDLHVYLGGVAAPSLYDFARGEAPFTYPPFAALLFRPLLQIPLPTVQILWTLASLATVTALAILFTRAARPGGSTQSQRQPAPAAVHPAGSAQQQPQPAPAAVHLARSAQPQRHQLAAPRLQAPRATTVKRAAAIVDLARTRWSSVAGGPAAGWVALAFMLSAPVVSDLHFGQVSIYLAAMVAADLLLLRRTPAFGVLIGIAAAIKLTPLIFIPLLFLAGRGRAAATATGTFTACTALAAIALPGDTWRFWTAEVFQVNRLGNIISAGNQSLNGMLLRFETPETPRTLIVLTVGGAIAAAALWRAARAARTGDWLTATIVTGAASIVLSPVSWTHHQIWLVAAVFLPVRSRQARPAWIALVLIFMLIPITGIDSPIWTNARLLLAAAIAAAVPLGLRQDEPRDRDPTTHQPPTKPSLALIPEPRRLI